MDTNKIFGEFPDGFRMTYKALWDIGSPTEMAKHYEAWDKLVEEHGGEPKMYHSRDGINA